MNPVPLIKLHNLTATIFVYFILEVFAFSKTQNNLRINLETLNYTKPMLLAYVSKFLKF